MPSLEFPNISHKDAFLDMITEWEKFEKIPAIPHKLFGHASYEDFLQAVEADVLGVPGKVPAHLFFFVDRGPGVSETNRRVNNEIRILGAIQVRHTIDHPNLIEVGGHIGYGIRPSERGKGYATEMLRLGLIEAQKLSLEKVLLTCKDTNTASTKVIEKNGGVFERFADKNGIKMRRYWITL